VTPEEVFQALVRLPREAGTPAAKEARELLTRHLEAQGYSVRRQTFAFQPAAANVLAILGAGLGWLTLLEIPLLLLGTPPKGMALLVWLGGMVALGVLAWGIGTGVDIPGAERRDDANLIATRGPAPVRRWIVAHVDSKAQGHSLAGRLAAIWALVLAAIFLTGLAAARWISGGPLASGTVAAGAGFAMVAGALAAQGRLHGTSPGARDNGSGLLAALVAAETCRDGIGFAFTGAEEFGLVGGRMFAGELRDSGMAEVINIDTVTGRGHLYVLRHDQRGGALAARVAAVLPAVPGGIRVRRLPLGILVDSLPMSQAGATAVTTAWLDWGDLRRLHTPRDTPEGLDLTAARKVGEALADLR
jgi:Peptidase family M28